MQILGKRSKILLITAAIAMLAALGLSFALWDTEAVKAASGSSSEYANAKVGDIVTFGQYYQEANSANKSPIEWIVVDKDERTGQLTLMSKYILAYGCYFGNYYNSTKYGWTSYYDDLNGNKKNLNDLLNGVPYNQAWVESTARAFLNNLERFDLGGDNFNATEGLSETRTNSKIIDATSSSFKVGKLIPSVGFSYARYWTGLSYEDTEVAKLAAENPEFVKRSDNNEVYYQRIKLTDPNDRLARNGFLEEAFTADEKRMIAPKVIPGQISHRWPNNSHFLNQAEYVPGTKDKVWLPSAEELNIKEGIDWNGDTNDLWTNPSELESSMPFEYFKNYNQFTNPVYNTVNISLDIALKTMHTSFAGQAGSLGNYSIPGWIPNEQLGNNTSNYYWTRSAPSYWHHHVRRVLSSGKFYANTTTGSDVGVRPCILLKY